MKKNEESVFTEALAKGDPQDRAAFLDQACAGDPALRESVDSLLAAYDAGSFLETPAVERPDSERKDQASGCSTQGEPTIDTNDSDSLEFLTPSAKPDALGQLGHYDVLEVIGKGGMGIVLRAFDEQLHRMVAIKVMAAQLATNASARLRFKREAQAQAAVSHDHILTIHAVEADGPLPYLVMQYVAGLSLQQRLDKDGPLDLQEILRIGMQTASGLAAAHAQGLVHRDIKPANILLENGVERVKVADFGLARAATEASLTQSGVVAGTPQYMSPEQAEGKTIDQRTDLFSLGSVMYAMCTGRAPFRASGTMAILKRVCEETPTPIRESNPEIPDWLVAIIEKLHAKDPAQRYQSAAEVAELLKEHLAHVQHPSMASAPLSPLGRGAGGEGRSHAQPRRRRLALAAAVLLCFIAGLSLTEAIGVTNLRATVIRIFTPDGTLVVEVDDPGVKVTIEGDGGLVITGAGLQEVRLKPGSYKVQAAKDGKRVPLERELVSIAKGGREVVKVKLEASPAPAAAKPEKGGFVLLAASKERKFDTLAEAVQNASDGDAIEVRGNGPFVSEPLRIGKQALTIRAGEGFRPVIRLGAPRDGQPRAYLIGNEGPLVLEGLEIQRLPQQRPEGEGGNQDILRALSGPLYVANCRFRPTDLDNGSAINNHMAHLGPPVCEIRNSELLCPAGYSVGADLRPAQRLIVDNCLLTGPTVALRYDVLDSKRMAFVRLTRNTFLGTSVPGRNGHHDGSLAFWMATVPDLAAPRLQGELVRFETMGNVFRGTHLVEVEWPEAGPGQDESEALLARTVGWQGQRNLFALDGPFSRMNPAKPGEAARLMKSLTDWKRFWGSAEASSIEGRVRFQGGDVRSKLLAAPEKLVPEDFRLRPDSAGYKAGKDGKDLGADVDLVGPGAAYERWRKTPEYQQWLKETGQLRAEAPKPEPKAFVLLGGKSVEIGTYDTLAEAVKRAGDGDTIEVRGNGPFVTAAVDLGLKALTIRAGKGFRPLIRLEHPPTAPGSSLLHSSAHLALEGLELHIPSTDPRADRRFIHAGTSLEVANCRFYSPGLLHAILGRGETRRCALRNCEFVTLQAILAVQSSELVVDNCIFAAGAIATYDCRGGRPGGTARIAHVTVVGGPRHGAIGLLPAALEEVDKKVGFRISESVLCPGALLSVGRPATPPEDGKPLTPVGFAALLPKLMTFEGTRNVYSSFDPKGAKADYIVSWGDEDWRHDLGGLAGWKSLWGSTETDCIEGRIKFANGDLATKITWDIDNVTPADFRLRPDSPGYRAGKDGKDLGADVDLVGPGPAYERWQKTPEYQKWLKDTKQVK